MTQEKVVYFKKLAALEDSSDDEQEVTKSPQLASSSKTFIDKTQDDDVSTVKDAPDRTARSIADMDLTVPKRKSRPTSTKLAENATLGKRKRNDTSFKPVSQDQQIFRGKHFYYIPPNDIAKQRRIQIARAREYGAVWEKEFTSDVTHIIVDRSLTYQDVMKYLRLETLPQGIIMTNENYPIDCIIFRIILNHEQRQYFVRGQPDMVEKGQILSQAHDASNPLQIKHRQTKPGKAGYSRSLPKNQGSSQGAVLDNPPKASTQPHACIDHNVTLGELKGLRTEISKEDISKTDHESATITHVSSRNDELAEMIRSTADLAHLPLDDDEESPPSSPDQLNISGEDPNDDSFSAQRHSSKPESKKTPKGAFNQSNFSCMTGGTGITSDTNPNVDTISILQQMSDYYARINDTWRPRAYRMATGTLRRQDTKITTAEQAMKLPFIGGRLALKIEEIVRTHRLRKLDNAKSDPKDRILQMFLGIYGVGLSQASRWVEQGYETLEDVKTHVQLSENQRIGLEHYEDFQTRIPREEVTALGNIVEHYAKEIDPAMNVIVGGSYRRGASTSGDVDCIITKPGTSSWREIMPLLNGLIDKLTDIGFLVAALTLPHSSKWHGCCVLPDSRDQVWRRIDFLLVPDTELGAALIYFTGDDIFNRSIRLLASKKGYRLNQRGLWKDVMRGPRREKISQGTLVEGADEKKIFSILGVPWRPPEQRICH